MSKRRILFVDDEPNVLQGLRNVLRRQRDRWDMEFCQSGSDALRALGERSFDVIVTDMRMPGMDGATLLQRVMAAHPGVVRIVLSGHAELEAAMRAIPVAHQFLAKPCDPAELERVVERACSLHSLINDQLVRNVVSKVNELPMLPGTYARLRSLMANDRSTMQEVAKVIQQDPGIAAKLLQIVNSAFFRLSRRITRIEEATTYLGAGTIQRIVLAAEVFSEPSGHLPDGSTVATLQAHSLAVATLASRLLPRGPAQEDAFTAGLLHDIGKLVLSVHLPEHIEQAMTFARANDQPLHCAEEALFGVSHAEIGGYLLGIWGLPYPVVEAVANHHAPLRVPHTSLGILGAVHIADALAQAIIGPNSPQLTPAQPAAGYLEMLQVTGKWEEWVERYREEALAAVSEMTSPPEAR